MIRSMTGFGHGAAAVGGWHVEATLRSVNHRHLSIRLRSLSDRPWLQSQIEEKVRAALHRGDVGVWLTLSEEVGTEAAAGFDRDVARRVIRALEGARAEFGLPGPLTLADLLRAGGLQTPQDLLGVEIARLLDVLEARGAQAEARFPGIQDDLRNKLRARIDELGLRVDPDRIDAEIVLCVDRFDVQEELVRLRGHVARTRQLLSRSGPVGKELDFLCQELLREVNTLGSKVRDGEVAGLTVDMKVAIEQLKEQVQNVE
jgi:uncharacterized protein YicC (UPF0701 family)